jgi:hypothetical protein
LCAGDVREVVVCTEQQQRGCLSLQEAGGIHRRHRCQDLTPHQRQSDKSCARAIPACRPCRPCADPAQSMTQSIHQIWPTRSLDHTTSSSVTQCLHTLTWQREKGRANAYKCHSSFSGSKATDLWVHIRPSSFSPESRRRRKDFPRTRRSLRARSDNLVLVHAEHLVLGKLLLGPALDKRRFGHLCVSLGSSSRVDVSVLPPPPPKHEQLPRLRMKPLAPLSALAPLAALALALTSTPPNEPAATNPTLTGKNASASPSHLNSRLPDGASASTVSIVHTNALRSARQSPSPVTEGSEFGLGVSAIHRAQAGTTGNETRIDDSTQPGGSHAASNPFTDGCRTGRLRHGQ